MIIFVLGGMSSNFIWGLFMMLKILPGFKETLEILLNFIANEKPISKKNDRFNPDEILNALINTELLIDYSPEHFSHMKNALIREKPIEKGVENFIYDQNNPEKKFYNEWFYKPFAIDDEDQCYNFWFGNDNTVEFSLTKERQARYFYSKLVDLPKPLIFEVLELDINVLNACCRHHFMNLDEFSAFLSFLY